MGEVIEISCKKLFNLSGARDILPVVRRVTKAAHDRVQQLSAQLTYISDPERKKAMEDLAQSFFDEWSSKIRKLGAEPKGLWLVDFDNGEGYYCWQYPESDIYHLHGYTEGFRGRTPIS